MSFAPDMGDSVDGLAIDLVVSRSVRDTAAALDAVAGNVDGDPVHYGPHRNRHPISEAIKAQNPSA